MGIFDWLFGSSDPVAAPTTSTTTSKTLPPYVEKGWERSIAEAERLASQPYQPYGGARVADWTEAQQHAFDIAWAEHGTVPDMVKDAMGGITQAGKAIDPWQTDRYMNPYLQGVGGQVERELNRRQSTEMQDIGTGAVKAGGYGGTRHAVLEAESGRNLDRNVADMYERLYSGGYDKAMSALQSDRDAAGNAAAANLTGAGAYGMAVQGDVQSLMNTGGAQQQLTQQGLNMAYGDFLNQRQYPYQQLGFYGDMVQGASTGGGSTTSVNNTGYTNDTGNYNQLAQAAGGIYNNWDDISSAAGGIWNTVSNW
tara:strand:+ start:4306 stop:5235 length:930 start_codon:yes stop_codon:yes gene_type:complete